MKGWVFLLQEIQPSLEILNLFSLCHACHKVMATAHNEAGQHLCGVPIIGGVYIETPRNALALLVVFHIRPKGCKAIRSAIMLQNYVPVRFSGVIIDVGQILYRQSALLFSFYAVSVLAAVILASQNCDVDYINLLV